MDAIIRAPLVGSALLSGVIALLGAFFFVRRQTLVGEVLAHATYPGVTLAICCLSLAVLPLALPCVALLCALLGLYCIEGLKHRLRLPEDSALCFTLATFFGMGTLVASWLQTHAPIAFRQLPIYLYGQAATLQDQHMYVYGLFALLVVGAIVVLYRPLLVISFDRQFAHVHRLSYRLADHGLLVLIASAIVLGMRALGIMLVSALLIAPATAARQWVHSLPKMLVLSALFGVGSGVIGTLISLRGLPTGPCVVLVACGCALFSLLFAPQRGVLFRWIRIGCFRLKIREENVLKRLWMATQDPSHIVAPWWLWYGMRWQGWVDNRRHLTPAGQRRGAHIVRLHRLWEAYLFHTLGMGLEKVHSNAETMEHILTPSLERELETILADPQFDPHAQPIPRLDPILDRGAQ